MGKGSIIGSFRGPWGIPVQIDGSILFLVGFLLYMSLGSNLIWGAVFAALLLLSIFLHEMGHALGCKLQGIPVRRVVLHGFGGFCEHGRAPHRHQDELIVALGPLMNLGLWALSGIMVWLLFSSQVFAYGAPLLYIASALLLFGQINLFLFLFNILPVHPLDGGTLIQFALLRFLPAPQAMRVSGAIGLLFAILWIPAAIWLFVTFGFILFFFPSLRRHYRMMKGQGTA